MSYFSKQPPLSFSICAVLICEDYLGEMLMCECVPDKNLFSRHGKGDLGLTVLLLLYIQQSRGCSQCEQCELHILNPHNDKKQEVVGSFLGKGGG